MRIVKRKVDPTSYNLEFYGNNKWYHGTLKFSSHDLIASAMLGYILENMPEIKFESVRYILMTGEK